MSVKPGFGGQEFIANSLDKVRRLRKMLDERGLKARIEIDGGINSDNVAEVPAQEQRSSSRVRQSLARRSGCGPAGVARSDSALGLTRCRFQIADR